VSFIQELKRRNVFRVAIAYVITTWLLLQVADVVLGNIAAPGWVFKAIMLVLAFGFSFLWQAVQVYSAIFATRPRTLMHSILSAIG
jgi:hypothetical protein